MGKKGGWCVAVKKAFSPDSKERRDQKTSKSKKKWGLGKERHEDPSSSLVDTVLEHPSPPPPEEVKPSEAENEESKQSYSVPVATGSPAEAASAIAQSATRVVRNTMPSKFSSQSMEEAAALKIQTAFRGYLARRALRALRGLVRLKSLIDGHAVKRQATNTLRCMQTLARVQSQIRSRRIRMSEENQALQRLLQQKHEKEFELSRLGEEWDDSFQSKEQLEANLQIKQEAALKRERALAYAFSHQQMWKNSSRNPNPMYMDPNNPQWGWSWLERWMAARPWDSRSTNGKELNDHSSIKSTNLSFEGGDITKAYARRELNPNKPSPTSQKPNRPTNRPSKAESPSSVTGKLKPGQDDDSRSVLSMQSERPRRHSIAGSSIRDDESLASSPSVPSYMAPTESVRAKSRLSSPSGIEKNGTPEKGSAKKRLSFPASPAGARRHSGPPRVDISSIKEIGVSIEQSVSIEGSK